MGEVVWVEGESATTAVVEAHGWYDSVKKEVLSGGGWLSHYGEAPGEAGYEIEVRDGGEYAFWARLNPVGSVPQWRIDGGGWAEVDLGERRGEQNIASDNKPDHRFIAWVKIGFVSLAEGSHEVGFRWSGGAANSGGLDCFVLTNEAFVPQGTLKPGDAGGIGGEGGSGAEEAEADGRDAIWIEGENPTEHSMNRHPWYDQVKSEILSGGDWISNFSKESPGEAAYDFEVKVGDEYAFWIRANPMANTRLEWKLDSGGWERVDFGDVRGRQNIAGDNQVDLRFIAWVKAGEVRLSEGEHAVRFRMAGGEEASNHGGLDCFVFTRVPFVPAGTRKPTVARPGGGTAGGWFPLLPDDDPFSPESVIDMSALVPAPAGELGVLRAVGKDLEFERGDGPVKLWGVGANVQPGRYSREQLTQRARYLRKFGVNIVRQHAVFDELNTGGEIDREKLDAYDWWFAELKKHGIYSHWSVFYHFTVGPDDGYPAALYSELEDRGGRKDTYGIITASPELWEIRNRVLAALLEHTNPYTGLRYADDPALAVVEMQNEDSIFFWNPLGWLAEGNRMPLHSKRLRERWAAWVNERYPTGAELEAAWGELRGGDEADAGELALMGPWELPGEGPRGTFAGQDARAGDYIRFLAEMQRADFEACEKVIRGTGFRAVTVTTGWQVGGAATEAANVWTDTAGDMIDRHNYFGGGAGGHGITEGEVENESHLAKPGSGIFSVGMRQVEDKPFSVTEWTQLPPNQWKLEAAPMMAFYGLGLQGWDASYHFIQSGTRLGDGWPGMSSYATDTPHFIGQFPALAFALHHGHVTESPVVAARRLDAGDLFGGRDALKQDFTQGDHDVKTVANAGGTPTEAFAFGRVTLSFGGGESEVVDFGDGWDEADRVVRSLTGELEWDYGREVITIGTPKTQGVVGKAGGRAFQLPGVRAEFKTPFVSTLFTPLDDLPLAESKHILITALARDMQRGARYNADGTELEAVGTAPLMLEPVEATLRFEGEMPASVRALDHYGVPTGQEVEVGADGTIEIDGTYRSYYYEIRR
ncbi:hypothetical protein BH23VER1_BH23VER1_11380 [soil metagenome]